MIKLAIAAAIVSMPWVVQAADALPDDAPWVWNFMQSAQMSGPDAPAPDGFWYECLIWTSPSPCDHQTRWYQPPSPSGVFWQYFSPATGEGDGTRFPLFGWEYDCHPGMTDCLALGPGPDDPPKLQPVAPTFDQALAACDRLPPTERAHVGCDELYRKREQADTDLVTKYLQGSHP